MPSTPGWTDIETEPRAQNPGVKRSFHVRSVDFPNGARLAVGEDLEPLEAIERAFLEALGIALLAFLVLSLTGGFVLSMGFLRQVDAVTHTAQVIIRGELTSRVASGFDGKLEPGFQRHRSRFTHTARPASSQA
jgi:hypothetical protein